MKSSEIELAVFSKPWPQLSAAALGQLVRGLGFDSLELPVRPGFQVEPEKVSTDLPKVAKVLRDEGIGICSIAGPVTEETFAACAEVGIPIIRVMYRVGEEGYMASETAVKRELDGLLSFCEKYGVRIGVQNHCKFFVPPHSMGLRHLLEDYDPCHIAAIWDAAHTALDGEEPEMGLDIVWPHLCMVNLKNGYWRRTTGPEAADVEWAVYWTSGRQGLASWPRTIKYLKERNYSGVVCLTAEYSATQDVDRLIKEDIAYAKILFATT
ncbi:MAG: TIM barrel protein [Firmicutes bacterium]|nr:TIM barrel protein [Bacillota bacterium]